jgi:IS5 family transposase
VKAAVDLGLEDGAKLRVDTTVVQTNIHHPTDNTLLWDAVRVLIRLLGRLGGLLGRRIEGFRNCTRAARRRMLAIQRMSATQRQGQQTSKYRELIGIAEQVVACARSALKKPDNARGKDVFRSPAITGLSHEIDRYCGLAARVIDQARRRVVDGEQVLNAEKVYSIFEPHTDLIKRGKVRTPMEFGHKVFLAESAKGLITQYQVLKGNPPDEQQVKGVAGTPQEDLWLGSRTVRRRSRLLQRTKPRPVRGQWHQARVHPSIRWQTSARARSL